MDRIQSNNGHYGMPASLGAMIIVCVLIVSCSMRGAKTSKGLLTEQREAHLEATDYSEPPERHLSRSERRRILKRERDDYEMRQREGFYR